MVEVGTVMGRAKDTDFAWACCVSAGVVWVDGASELICEVEEERVVESEGAEMFGKDTVEDGVAFGAIKDKLPPEDIEVFVAVIEATAEGRDGRLPDKVVDNLTPDKGFGVPFELATAVVVDGVARVDKLVCREMVVVAELDLRGSSSSAVRISLSLAAAAWRSFFKSS